uniref:Gag1-like clamp domain-containing protein n=1 Tax=Kalanchoe fedtschenkoi TaxID=63787 RepID=A0A7N0UDF8_KALFE
MTEVSPAGKMCSTEKQGFQFCTLTTEVESCTERNTREISWNENRKQWVGDRSHRRRNRVPDEPIISWSSTYEDLLWTGNVFDKAIPLSEMVDFLVDIWHDEGLYD